MSKRTCEEEGGEGEEEKDNDQPGSRCSFLTRLFDYPPSLVRNGNARSFHWKVHSEQVGPTSTELVPSRGKTREHVGSRIYSRSMGNLQQHRTRTAVRRKNRKTRSIDSARLT